MPEYNSLFCYSKQIIVSLLITALTQVGGCGFHLRGQGSLPTTLQALVLDCEPVKAQNLCKEIGKQLKRENIKIIDPDNSPDTKNAALVIQELKDKRRAASIAQDASTAEIEFSRTVDFVLLKPSSEVPPQPMKATQYQTYQYTELSVLGKEKEEQQVRENLDQLLATDILNRMGSMLTNPDKPTP